MKLLLRRAEVIYRQAGRDTTKGAEGGTLGTREGNTLSRLSHSHAPHGSKGQPERKGSFIIYMIIMVHHERQLLWEPHQGNLSNF